MSVVDMARRFRTAEDGAVTVDWVVLTAGIAGLAIAVMAGITGNMGSIGAAVNTFLAAQTVVTTF